MLAERFEFSSPEDLPGVQLAIIENCGRLVQMVHETYTTALIVRGTRRWNCNGMVLRSEPGAVLAWEPGDSHNCLEPTLTTQRGLLLKPEVMRGIAEEAGAHPDRLHVKVRQSAIPALTQSFRRFYSLMETHSTRLERQTRFLESIKLLLKYAFAEDVSMGGQGGGSQEVRRICDYIRDHFAQNIGLEELARESRLSRFRIIRAFKKHVGTTPHSFHIDYRLAKARDLLRTGESAVQVAATVGFNDQSHFIRHFKRVFGMTPEQYCGKRARAGSSRKVRSLEALVMPEQILPQSVDRATKRS